MTIALDDKQRRAADELRTRLVAAAGDRLVAVVLHGPATQGERATWAELATLIVLADLELATLRPLAGPVAWWCKQGAPTPRLFSPALLASSRDVFPLELLDLAGHRELLHGPDPLVGLTVDDEHLRMQCEREITEKLMRLREAYLEADGSEKALRRLLAASFPAFVQILRGGLRLLGAALPDRPGQVAEAFARAAGLDPAPLAEVAELRARGGDGAGVVDLFDRYYRVLQQAAEFIDRHVAAPAALALKGATQ